MVRAKIKLDLGLNATNFLYLQNSMFQGNRPFNNEVVLLNLEEYYALTKVDITNNSFSGFTICPNSELKDIKLDEFIDSLININNRSYELNWIKDQPTYEKYADLLNQVKTGLQTNDIIKTQNALQNILEEVDIDSSSNLTSEAYALLKYNMEYLIENLPEPSPYLVVKLINSQNSLLTGGTLKYYEGGWKGRNKQ